MRFMDPDYNQMVLLTTQGRYGLKVNEAERFLVKFVGTLTEFTSAQHTLYILSASGLLPLFRQV
jgi:hypothetical protein